MRAARVAVVGVLALAAASAYAASRVASVQDSSQVEGEGEGGWSWPTFDAETLEPGEAEAPGVLDEVGAWVEQAQGEVMGNSDPYINPQANVAAALAAIRWAEGTAREPDPYRVCYGYKHTIQSFADHPAVTGEWHGEVLPDRIAVAAGASPGAVSTAAGAYQIRRATWLEAKAGAKLSDFTPASQDAAAVWLLRRRGALALIEQGRFLEGIAKARKEWASLPGAGYEQGERSPEALVAKYTSAGGVLA